MLNSRMIKFVNVSENKFLVNNSELTEGLSSYLTCDSQDLNFAVEQIKRVFDDN